MANSNNFGLQALHILHLMTADVSCWYMTFVMSKQVL